MDEGEYGAVKKQADVYEEQETGSKIIIEKLFGVELGKLMADAVGGYRNIIETTSAVTQCNNVLGKFNEGTICYVCGVAIPDKTNREISDWLYVECEHILPVGQARAFLDIYTQFDLSKSMSPKSIESYNTALKLEYAYAHRLCNQVKKNKSFIGNPTLDATKVAFNPETTMDILTKIRSQAIQLSSSAPVQDKPIYEAIASMNIQDRRNYIKGIIENISDHIGEFDEELNSLVLLSRLATMTDLNRLHPKARKIYHDYVNRTKNFKTEYINAITTLYPFLTKETFVEHFYQTFSFIPEKYRIDLSEFIDRILDTLSKYYEESYQTQSFDILLSVYYNAFKHVLGNYIHTYNPVLKLNIDKPDPEYIWIIGSTIGTMNGFLERKNKNVINIKLDDITENGIKMFMKERPNYETKAERPGRYYQKEQAEIDRELEQELLEREEAARNLIKVYQSNEQQKGGLRKRFQFKLNARTTSLRIPRTSKHSRLQQRKGKSHTYRIRQSAGKSITRRQRFSLGGLRPSIPSHYGGNSDVQTDVEWGSFYANN